MLIYSIIIFVIVSLVYILASIAFYLEDSLAAKREGRPVNSKYRAMFIVGIGLGVFYVLCIIAIEIMLALGMSGM